MKIDVIVVAAGRAKVEVAKLTEDDADQVLFRLSTSGDARFARLYSISMVICRWIISVDIFLCWQNVVFYDVVSLLTGCSIQVITGLIGRSFSLQKLEVVFIHSDL